VTATEADTVGGTVEVGTAGVVVVVDELLEALLGSSR
jgi:hypothetical protein